MAPKKPKKQDQERAKGVGSGQDGSLEEQIKTILRRLRARDEGLSLLILSTANNLPNG